MQRVCDASAILYGSPVFLTEADTKDFNRRLVSADNQLSLVETKLRKDCDKLRDSNVTLIVGGASGGGKTLAVIGLGQKANSFGCSVVVYGTSKTVTDPSDDVITPPSTTSVEKNHEPGLNPLLEALTKMSKENRDERMLELLEEFVKKRVNSEVLAIIRSIQTDGRKFTLVVALDEMGAYPAAVRAMCGASESLKSKLKLPKCIKVRLVAAGTGVGNGDTEPGSSNSSYTLYAVEDASNMDVFDRWFGRNSFSVDKTPLVQDPHVATMIRGNARMAAILGHMARKTKASFSVSNLTEQKLVEMLDLGSFLVQAAFRFKALNGLEPLPLDNMSSVMVHALRMHFFPHTYNINDAEYKNMVTKYGLVVDRLQWKTVEPPAKDSYKAASGNQGPVTTETIVWSEEIKKDNQGNDCQAVVPKYSRFDLPPFSTSVLALLCGRSVITKSVVSGATLERYWLSVSFLLACAACSADLFLTLLAKDRLEPLNVPSKEEMMLMISLRKPRQLCATVVELDALEEKIDTSKDNDYHPLALDVVELVIDHLRSRLAEKPNLSDEDKESAIQEVLNKLKDGLVNALPHADTECQLLKAMSRVCVDEFYDEKHDWITKIWGGQSIVRGFRDGKNAEYNKILAKICNASGPQPAVETVRGCGTFVSRVRETLKSAQFSQKEQGKCCIAAIGCSDKFSFADSLLFVDDTLFLFQVKDWKLENLSNLNVHYERWKMGAVDDEAVIAFLFSKPPGLDSPTNVLSFLNECVNSSTSQSTPSNALFNALEKSFKNGQNKSKNMAAAEKHYRKQFNLVNTLAMHWKSNTGITITRVQRCFVTPVAFAPDGFNVKDCNVGGVTINKDVFVSVDGIKFLIFQKKEKAKSFNVTETNEIMNSYLEWS